MFTVYKYPIPLTDAFTLRLPIGWKALTVQTQGGEPMLWALVNPKSETATYDFRLAGTGHPIDERPAPSYIGTFQLRGGALVFHLFAQDAEVPNG